MEVVAAENAGTVENQVSNEPQPIRFTWNIRNFSCLSTERCSAAFAAGGIMWCVVIIPNANGNNQLSMYLDVADPCSLPYGYKREVHFSLAVLHPKSTKSTIKKSTRHEYSQSKSRWGFRSFMPLSDLQDPQNKKGFLKNNTCVIQADVVVQKSKSEWGERGYVGLQNEGATCYMNSMLQTLYHIPCFRKDVYSAPKENDNPILLALQRLFVKLQNSDTSVSTKDLTKSFGWVTPNSFSQKDLHEFNKYLFRKLEDEEGTFVKGIMKKLFEGHQICHKKCIKISCESTTEESFYDLQLDVKGCKDVYESFDKFVEEERLEGDNKYRAEEHGLQDAKKCVLFKNFPPVLQLQLKRFEYDTTSDTAVKINARYEFPLELDLDTGNGKYLSPVADKSIRNLYKLHSVLVHSGGVHGGHYYAYIRPRLSDEWYKFDDERVTKEDVKRATEEVYGCEEEVLLQTNANAYVLVYIRVCDMDMIFCDVEEKELEKIQEKENKRISQAHMYTNIQVARDEDLKKQIGKEIYFDLVDHDKVKNFWIKNEMPFCKFKEQVAQLFDIKVEFQRFWIWAKRKNNTYRPSRPLTQQEEGKTVGALMKDLKQPHNAELKLFLESLPKNPAKKNKRDTMLFFKRYDPEKEELQYVGNLSVNSSTKPIEILPKLKEMGGFAPEEEIELFEEIRFEPSVLCECLEQGATFGDSGIEDGDIICIQKRPLTTDEIRFRDVSLFLDFVKNGQGFGDSFRIDDTIAEILNKTLKVYFHNATKDEVLILTLPKQSTVGDVLNEIKTKVKLSYPNAQLRLLEIFNHKIYKILPHNEKIEYIDDQYWTLLAEEIPEDEKNLDQNGRLIHVYHFTRETEHNQEQVRHFGKPFFLVIHEGETLANVKARIQKKLQISEEEYSKWKFAFLPLGRLEDLAYLEDSDIVSSHFQRIYDYGAWEPYLGLEHADTTPRREPEPPHI